MNYTKFTLALLSLTVFTFTAFSQNQFINTYEYSTNLTVTYSGPAAGGGIITCGYTDATTPDGFITKTGLDGNVQWSKKIGGSQEDYLQVVKATSDGGYIAVGYTNSSGAGGKDVLLIKLNANGGISWSKTYGTSTDDYGNDVIQTSDGGYAVCGKARTQSSTVGYGGFYVFKTNASGTLSWSNMWGEDESITAYDIIEKPDGSIIATGSNWGGSPAIVEMDASGNMNWAKAYDTGYNYIRKSIQTLLLSDGSLMNYYSARDNNKELFYLVKINASGDYQWSKEYYANSNSYDDFYGGIIRTYDGFVVSGKTMLLQTGVYAPTYIKLDNAGIVLSSKAYVDYTTYAYSDKGFELERLSDGSLLTGFSHYSKIVLLKSNWTGEMWCSNTDITIDTDTPSGSSTTIGSSSWVNSGTTTVNNSSLNSTDMNLTKSVHCNSGTGINDNEQREDVKVFPNPTGGQFKVELGKEYNNVSFTLYNTLSEAVYSKKTDIATSITVHPKNIAAGVYYYKITSDNKEIAAGKVVLE